MRLMCAVCILQVFLCLCPWLHAQEKFQISGRVLTADQQPLQNASVSLKDSATGAILAFAISKADGRFMLHKEGFSDAHFLLVVEHLNTNREVRKILLTRTDSIQPDYLFILHPVARQLKEVIIKASADPFSIRGDTVEYKAKAYKTAETRKVQDLLRNIQGFELGSDGKISFNGKEVDRILIEGEDLTEKNYQLLSRNLNATLVDRVQVIHNYSTNRLLKDVEKSGKVGINLTIDAKFKNKISGAVEAGYGAGERAFIDNSLVLITPKIKLLSFLNYNETGLPANANLQYYFNPDESTAIPVSADKTSKGFLETGIIELPQLGQSYTRNNEDISAFAIGSWKAGEAIQMKVLAGTGRGRIQNRASGFSQFLPADGNSWVTCQDDRYQSCLTEGIMKLSITHDRQKNNTGSFTANVLRNRSLHQYDNLSAGAITDTLNEKLHGGGWSYRLAGNETFRFGKGNILKASVLINREDLAQQFHARTNRYQDFFKLDSTFRYFLQHLDGVLTSQEFDLEMYGRNGLYTWYTGLHLIREASFYRGGSKSVAIETKTTIELGEALSEFHSLRANAYGMLSRRVQKKGEINSGLSIGAGAVTINLDNKNDHKTMPVVRGILGYRHSLSPLKNISLQYQYSGQLPDRMHFFPSLLLSGQATILNPAEKLVIRRNHLLSFTYASNNLVKGTGFYFHTSYSHTDGAYMYSKTLTPEYGLLYYLSQDGNQLWNANAKMEQYVKGLSAKFSLQFSSVYATNRIIFNNVPSENKMRSVSLQQKTVTAFKAPVNLEVLVTAMYIRNSTVPENGQSSRFDLWQYQGYGKMKVRAGKKLYTALMYNYYILSPGNYFHTMDLYANLEVSKAWTISLTVHNLFNASAIQQRQFAVNSIDEQRYELVDRYLLIKLQFTF